MYGSIDTRAILEQRGSEIFDTDFSFNPGYLAGRYIAVRSLSNHRGYKRVTRTRDSLGFKPILCFVAARTADSRALSVCPTNICNG